MSSSTSDQLARLSFLGAPLPAALSALYVGNSSTVLHANPRCISASTSRTVLFDPVARCAYPTGERALQVCSTCHQGAAFSTLHRLLIAMASVGSNCDQVGRNLSRAEKMLTDGSSPAALLGAGEALRWVRTTVDPSMFADGVPHLLADLSVLPDSLIGWLASYQGAALARYQAAFAGYLGRGELDSLVAALWRTLPGPQRPPAPPTGERYIVVATPSETLSGSRLVAETLGTLTPVAWFGSGLDAYGLYRMPAMVSELIANRHVAPVGAFTDIGEVRPTDTAELLTAAAALYDAGGLGAPLNDPEVALLTARQLLGL